MEFETGERATECRGYHEFPGAVVLCEETTPSWRTRYSQPLRLPVGLSAAELDPATL